MSPGRAESWGKHASLWEQRRRHRRRRAGAAAVGRTSGQLRRVTGSEPRGPGRVCHLTKGICTNYIRVPNGIDEWPGCHLDYAIAQCPGVRVSKPHVARRTPHGQPEARYVKKEKSVSQTSQSRFTAGAHNGNHNVHKDNHTAEAGGAETHCNGANLNRDGWRALPVGKCLCMTLTTGNHRGGGCTFEPRRLERSAMQCLYGRNAGSGKAVVADTYLYKGSA